MANNQDVFECFEDYMDELIENFEDFAKKSLVLIATALGSIILMAMYCLRQATSSNPQNRRILDKNECMTYCTSRELTLTRNPSKKIRKEKVTRNESMLLYEEDAGEMPEFVDDGIVSRLSSEEKLITEVKLSTGSQNYSSSYQNTVKRTEADTRSFSPQSSRKAASATLEKQHTQELSSEQVPAKPTFSPTCLPKHHLSQPRQCTRYIATRNSCCSMCCNDDDRR